MKCAVNASGSDRVADGSDLVGTEMSAMPRKMLSVPSVTMNGCIRSPTTSAPLISPQSRPMPSGTTTATGRTTQALASSAKSCSTAAVPSAASPKIEPTEMSIPPATMTNRHADRHDRHPRHRRRDVGHEVVEAEEVVDLASTDRHRPARKRQQHRQQDDDEHEPGFLETVGRTPNPLRSQNLLP